MDYSLLQRVTKRDSLKVLFLYFLYYNNYNITKKLSDIWSYYPL